jgi:hypothetical protein
MANHQLRGPAIEDAAAKVLAHADTRCPAGRLQHVPLTHTVDFAERHRDDFSVREPTISTGTRRPWLSNQHTHPIVTLGPCDSMVLPTTFSTMPNSVMGSVASRRR